MAKDKFKIVLKGYFQDEEPQLVLSTKYTGDMNTCANIILTELCDIAIGNDISEKELYNMIKETFKEIKENERNDK